MSIKSRLQKTEEKLKEIYMKKHIEDPWEKINPDEIKNISEAVNTFQKHYSNELAIGSLKVTPGDCSADKKTRILFSNFITIVTELILRIHRSSIGSNTDKLLLEKISNDKNLSIIYNTAMDSYKKHSEI